MAWLNNLLYQKLPAKFAVYEKHSFFVHKSSDMYVLHVLSVDTYVLGRNCSFQQNLLSKQFNFMSHKEMANGRRL